MAKQTLKIGDKVSGDYHGVKFTGIIESYDGSGYVYVQLDTFVTVYGIERDGLAISPHERDILKLETPREGEANIEQASYAAMGGAYLVLTVEERRALYRRYRAASRMDPAAFDALARAKATEMAGDKPIEPSHWTRAARDIWHDASLARLSAAA